MHRTTLLVFCLIPLGFSYSLAAAQMESVAPIAYEVPEYPPLAKQASIQGEVLVEVVTDGRVVVSAHALRGQKLLAESAVKNVETWQFVGHEPGKFTLTYQYSLRTSGGPSSVRFQSPNIIAVEAQRPEVYAVFSKTEMGSWRLQASTAWGKSEMTMTPFRGPYSLYDNRESLDGKIEASDGSKFSIQYGRIDGSHVEFCVETIFPGNGPNMALYKGEINGENMAGTFSNAMGTEGTWTAMRQQSTQ